jgi:acyl-CoA thioester hydrolase
MNEAPPSGRVDRAQRRHVFAVRVYYEDTDAAGIVYYVNYLKFAERARTEMLRLLGFEQQRMRDERGVAFAVKSCSVDYVQAARLDDALEVHSSVLEIGGASLRLRQAILRGGETVAEILVRLAVMNRDGRPVRLPADLRDRLMAAAGASQTAPMQ